MGKYDENPYTAVYDALADRVFSDEFGIGALVKGRAQVRFDHTAPDDPRRIVMGEGDTPEVQLLPAGVEARTHEGSTLVAVEMLFDVEIMTQDVRAHKGLYPLLWGLTVAVAKSDDDLGLPYVSRVWLTESTEDRLDDDPQATLGWVSFATIGVLLLFDRDAIKTGEGSEG